MIYWNELKNLGNYSNSGKYLDVSCAFDIETSSFYYNNKKQAIPYIWQIAIDGIAFYGRTIDEFLKFTSYLENELKLSKNRILIIYVHNLGYEFQFIRKFFEWEEVFADKERAPIYAKTRFFEFRCSYRLSGYSLEKVAEHLENHKIKKLIGELDYKLIRSPETELSKEELAYCENDVLILNAYIDEYREKVDGINNIPYTSTGVVRRHTKQETIMKKGTGNSYKKLMKNLVLNNKEEYLSLREAFYGGFTHANAYRAKITNYNVHSYDFTSSYPAVMCSELFPMSKASYLEIIQNEEQLEKLCLNYCVIFSIALSDVTAKFPYENYISYSRCIKPNGINCEIEEENGRVFRGKHVILTLTNLDWDIIKRTYDFKIDMIYKVYYYKKDYLPKAFIEVILNLYEKKNLLKGVKGKEQEYLHSKGMLNSLYGMSVTDIVHNGYIYDNEIGWEKDNKDLEEAIKKYNNEKERFLFYPWGVFVTAYARHNLWTAILAIGEDYIYSDTDSVKIINNFNGMYDKNRNKVKKHDKYFNLYNDMIKNKLLTMCKHYDIDSNKVHPKDKWLGVWDYEGIYSKFKTCGAKRYLYEKDGKLGITVAGLGKKTSVEYLKKKKNPFKYFSEGMIIPENYTGKLTHTYIDDIMIGVMKDYKGQYYNYNYPSGIHLSPAGFMMSLTSDYINYLLNIKDSGMRLS